MSNLAEQSCDNNISLMRVDQVDAPFVGNTDCVPALSITKMPEICDVVDGSGEGIPVHCLGSSERAPNSNVSGVPDKY